MASSIHHWVAVVAWEQTSFFSNHRTFADGARLLLPSKSFSLLANQPCWPARRSCRLQRIVFPEQGAFANVKSSLLTGACRLPFANSAAPRAQYNCRMFYRPRCSFSKIRGFQAYFPQVTPPIADFFPQRLDDAAFVARRVVSGAFSRTGDPVQGDSHVRSLLSHERCESARLVE